MLEIKTTKGNPTVMQFMGRVDTISAQQMERELEEVLPGETNLVLDFAGLEYIASAGLRALLEAVKIMKRQGQMKVINVNEVVMETLEITKFTNFLTIE